MPSAVERRLSEMGITLPRPWALPPGVVFPASLVRVRGRRVLVSGHVPIDADDLEAAARQRLRRDVGQLAHRQARHHQALGGAAGAAPDHQVPIELRQVLAQPRARERVQHLAHQRRRERRRRADTVFAEHAQ